MEQHGSFSDLSRFAPCPLGQFSIAWVSGFTGLMRFDPSCAESMGTLLVESPHKPFRALACPLSLTSVRITLAKPETPSAESSTRPQR